MGEIDQGFFKLTERSEVNLKKLRAIWPRIWPKNKVNYWITEWYFFFTYLKYMDNQQDQLYKYLLHFVQLL